MPAALRLRLREGWRRGGLAVLCVGSGIVFAVARWGDDTVAGRFSLATDLAIVFGYVAAVFYGALPIAADRERRRALLAASSPTRPVEWAIGNALGAAVLVGAAMVVFLAAATVGTAAAGGIATYETGGLNAKGIFRLPPPGDEERTIDVREGVQRLRLALRADPLGDVEGTSDVLTVEANGKIHKAPFGHTMEIEVEPGRLVLWNMTRGYDVGVVIEDTRVLRADASFLGNSLSNSFGPGLGAAALAAFGAAMGALFTGPVAALVTALLLLLASLRGFLLEAAEYGGTAQEQHVHSAHPERPGPDVEVRDASRAVIAGLLTIVPDLHALDGSGRVALGEWNGSGGVYRASLYLLIALAVAAMFGGWGVHTRRLE